jgi:hypothetical protein
MEVIEGRCRPGYASVAVRPSLIWGVRRLAAAFQPRQQADRSRAARPFRLGQWLTNARVTEGGDAPSVTSEENADATSASTPSPSMSAGENDGLTTPSSAAAHPSLDRTVERLESSADGFSRRLEHASLNLLQCVEGMRTASAELGKGAGRVEEYHVRMEAMFRHVEQMASQIAAIEARQQERLEMIAAALHGISVSLTTVVAAANESQVSVASVAQSIAESVDRLDRGLDRLGDAFKAGTDRLSAASTPCLETVTLRQMMEVQRQFINTLDDRLACLPPDRGLKVERREPGSSSDRGAGRRS